jgi:hypothetical protein
MVRFKIVEQDGKIIEKEGDEAVKYAREIVEEGGIILVGNSAVAPEDVLKYEEIEVLSFVCD